MRFCVESKALFTSLSTKRNSIERSSSSYVSFIRFKFRASAVDKIYWVPGNDNLADPLTKEDS